MDRGIDAKKTEEIKIIKLMIQLYCHKNHHSQDELCRECDEIYQYAVKRIDRCPMMKTKTFCSQCKVHCYETTKREAIRKIMRYSGPRMIFYHPCLALKHLYYTIKQKKTEKKARN